jgi:cytochrome c-type biogenesis protein
VIEAIFGQMQRLYEVLGSSAQISPWVYLLVMIGGVASAISPCYVPLLAMFGGYVGGYAPETKTGGLRLALPFILGNAVTLAMVGAIATVLGKTALNVFTGYQLDRWIPGVVGLLMGLQLLGILKLKIPAISTLDWERKPGTGFGSFALGLPFGLVVTPCTIPIFFAIVAFVALQGRILHGALLMVAYALGRGIILTAVAVSVGLLKALNIARSTRYVARASGVLILVVSIGLLLFYDTYGQFTARRSSSPSDTDVALGQERGENQLGRGSVVSIDQTGAKVTLKHDEIRGLMPQMTMEFNVQPGEMLKGFRVGDKVQFTLTGNGDNFIITSIEKDHKNQ